MEKKTGFNLWYVLAAVMAVLVIQYFWTGYRQVEHIAYSTFLAELEAGNVERITVTETRVRGKLREAVEGRSVQFETFRVDDSLAERLARNQVEFYGDTDESLFGTILSWTVPAIIFAGLWYFR